MILNKKFFVVILFFSTSAFAAVDDLIFIQGRIGNAFDKNRVRVIDNHNQVFWLPRSVLPKNMKIKEGEVFNIEISSELFEKGFKK